ncbi:MAG: hypothetical protein J6Z14_14685 [Prevotella sp.]|nr:hypothetical protein [Prevotella sp.]
MNPALLNANLPEYETNPNTTEVAAPEHNATPEKVYVMSPQEEQQTRQPLSSHVEPENIVYQRRFKAEGKNWTMYYYNVLKERLPDYVMNIVLIPDDYKKITNSSKHELSIPPTVKKLIYHKTGDSREFEGAWINEIIKDSDGQFYKIEREIKLPDDIANEINSLLSDETQFRPNPNLVKSFTIKSTLDLEPTKKY